MEFVLKPSLKHIALVKVAIMLWNESDIKDQFDKFPPFHKWDKIESMVADKVAKLELPELLKEETLAFIKPIGKQIFLWINWFFEDAPDNLPIDFSHLLTVLCWTSHGTVDKKKTAELLLKNEGIDIIKRYIIASLYCLEDDIQKLWGMISEHDKENLFNENYSPVYTSELVKFWTFKNISNLYKGRNPICFSYQYRFECAAMHNDIVAVQCFWQKLAVKEREEALDKIGKRIRHPNVICFLLSHMDVEQRINLFRCLSCNMLQHFLDWPWQSFFLEIASKMPYSHDDYHSLLMYITKKSYWGFNDYKYEHLYKEFWLQPSDEFRKYIIENFLTDVVRNLFAVKFSDNIKLIFENTTPLQKSRLLFSKQGQELFQDLIVRNNWDLLQFFIQECISSNYETVKLKEELELKFERDFLMNREKFNKLFQNVESYIRESDKEKFVEE